MSKINGQLLFNRQQIELQPNLELEVDTGLCQTSLAFAPGDPTLGTTSLPIDPDNGSRVQVVPLAPLGAWNLIGHSEPFLDPITGTVKVRFTSANEGTVKVNVLFWDPSTAVGPGLAHRYAVILPS